MIAAMGEGETEIVGYLDAADTRSTLAAVQAVGARLVDEAFRQLDLYGQRGGRLKAVARYLVERTN